MFYNTFRSRICSCPAYQKPNGGRYRQSSPLYYLEFTKHVVIFPEETKKHFAFVGNNTITPFGEQTGIKEHEKYALTKLIPYSECWSEDSEFQVKFQGGVSVNLIMDKSNERRMKWIHGLHPIQNIRQSTINILIAIALVIVGAIGIRIQYLSYVSNKPSSSDTTQKEQKGVILLAPKKTDSVSYQEKKKSIPKTP
jgi:hypothetical protein